MCFNEAHPMESRAELSAKNSESAFLTMSSLSADIFLFDWRQRSPVRIVKKRRLVQYIGI